MNLILNYLKEKISGIILFILLTFFFTISFYLYHLPVLAVVYPFTIFVLVCIIYLVYDFLKFRKKYSQLELLKDTISLDTDSLPVKESMVESQYQSVVGALLNELKLKNRESQRDYYDMVDYYTIWAHQIKTPIASMNLTLQGEDSVLSRYIKSDLTRIEQYVDMVLAYLRLDSTNTDYVFKKHSLDKIVRIAVKTLSNDFIQKKISLELLPINKNVVTDEKWLVFVLEQLISNSLKYTKEGFIKIYMKDEWTICIEDSGIGISPEDLPRVFEKGYTGYIGRSELRASGIGLYLCKRICINLGAALSISSSVNIGTIVCITFNQNNSLKE